MNKNIIELVAVMKEYPNNPKLFLKGLLKIDGQEYHPELVLDLIALVQTCQCSGEFYIFSCGCGEPMCAGINDGIHVEHLPDAVIWRFYEPISGKDYEDLNDDEWEAIKRPVEYVFEPNQYLEAIISGLLEIKGLAISSARPIELAIYDLDVAKIINLEPLVFSARLNTPEKRLIAKQIEIDVFYDSFSAGGMQYGMNELFLPLSLCEAYRKWKALRVFPTLKEDLPAYQVYLEEGRKFCQGLRQYLGGKTKVKFKYHPPQFYNALAWEIIEEIR